MSNRQGGPAQSGNDAVDILLPVRNAFYIGNYQQCIVEANKLASKVSSDSQASIELSCLQYRAYIAQKSYKVPIRDINASACIELKCIQKLAEFFKDENDNDAALEFVKNAVSTNSENDYVRFVLAIMQYYRHNYEETLKQVYQSNHLESIALNVQTLLRMDLVERAKKEVKRMQDIDDDSILTQLANAWVNIATGGEKYQDAYYTYQELAEKYTPTVLLLNGQAVAHLHQGRFEQAESLLQSALEKDSKDADTLVNLIVVSQQLSRPVEVVQRFLNQLKDECPSHPFTKDLSAKEDAFTRAVALFSPEVSS